MADECPLTKSRNRRLVGRSLRLSSIVSTRVHAAELDHLIFAVTDPDHGARIKAVETLLAEARQSRERQSVCRPAAETESMSWSEMKFIFAVRRGDGPCDYEKSPSSSSPSSRRTSSSSSSPAS